MNTIVDSDQILYDIAHQLLQIRKENVEIKMDLVRLSRPSIIRQFEKPAIPLVYLNASEVCRVLQISHSPLMKLVKNNIVIQHDNAKTRTNQYLLSEIMWLSTQGSLMLNARRIINLIAARKEELGY